MEISSKLPEGLQDAYNSFYTSLEQDEQQINAAVQNAALDQDNSNNPQAFPTQQTS